ncbi:hypothetical protein [Oribacterium sp. NK2B42]|uniref:hypothetical protein n=1 Tax=Oribacterium sp. NK2B42 TaxID=689781 RepID=UPI0003F91BF3|nr:hypothetical protein [Oribacterium sp. NK2B42]
MKQKVERRKNESDFTSKETKTVKYDTRTTSEKVRTMIQSEAQKIEDAYRMSAQKEDSDDKLNKIRTKYMYGGNLSPDELDYIRRKDAKLYSEIKAEKDEIKNYEKKLRTAKTKEETQRVMADEANAALSKVNAVSNNPHISEADKMAVCAAEYRKLKKKQEIFDKFMEKGEYAKLPTDAEKREAEREIMEAREEELRNAGRTEEETEKNGNNLNSDERPDTAISDDRSPGKRSDTALRDSRSPGKKKVSSDSTKKVYKSTADAESTPEALKVKRAKNNSGRGKLYNSDNETGDVSSHMWEA